MKKLIALVVLVLVVINSGVSLGESVMTKQNVRLAQALEV